jgi:hypothetical protein
MSTPPQGLALLVPASYNATQSEIHIEYVWPRLTDYRVLQLTRVTDIQHHRGARTGC